MSKLCCLHFYIRKRFNMNFTSFVRCSRNILNNLKNQPFKQTPHNFNKSSRCIQPVVINGKRNSHSFHSVTLLPSIGFVLGFSFFKSKEEEEETPEDKLIMTIKQSILSIQRKEYDKAEQLLHLALRMAQDIQHKDGVTYVYDVLANLAMERGQFKKAEKLFTDVMKRLFASGETEESLKILHISSKIAHMAHLQENLDKALQGFRWTLGKLEEQLKKLPDSEDIKEIKAITCDWFGQMLIEDQNYTEAKKCFQQAYDLFVERYGNTYSELVPLLNNLSVASLGLEDFKSAKEYLMQALELLKAIPDDSTEGLLQANLGLIYLRQGLIQQAKTTCSYAYKIGKKLKDKDSIDQACYCLDEVKKAMEA